MIIIHSFCLIHTVPKRPPTHLGRHSQCARRLPLSTRLEQPEDNRSKPEHNPVYPQHPGWYNFERGNDLLRTMSPNVSDRQV